MKSSWIVCTILVGTVVWGLINNVFAGVVMITPARMYELNKELLEVSTKPNAWGYKVAAPPDIVGGYLNDIAANIAIDKCFTDTNEALRFALPIYEDFLNRINSVRTIRPFLLEFPITPKTCYLCIKTYFKNSIQCQHVGAICFHPAVEVRTWIPQPDLPKRGRIKEEWFQPDQLSELSKLYHNGILRAPVMPKPVILPLEKLEGTAKEAAQYRFFDFFKKWVPQFSLKIIISGETDPLKVRESDFCLAMVGGQQLSLQEARKIASLFGRDAFRFIREDAKCIEYFKRISTRENREIAPSPDYIALRISFWDDNIDRVVQPFIAEIRYVDGIFRYYTADELQRLVLVYEETFDEAMKFLAQQSNGEKR